MLWAQAGFLYSLFTSAALLCSGWGKDYPFYLLQPHP